MEMFDQTVKNSLNPTSHRVQIFNVFSSTEDIRLNSDQENPQRKITETLFLNEPKIADLHEWLVTSYYGSLNSNNNDTVIPIEYPKLDEFLVENCIETKSEEINSLLNENEKLIENDTSTVQSYDFGLCKNCKSRYTRHRTTRYFRIIWILISVIILSFIFFPWGFLSMIFLSGIPSQIRRPMCRKCRSLFWAL